MKSILFILIAFNSFLSFTQDEIEILQKYNYITTTQFDGTTRTSKFLCVLASVNKTNNFIILDQEIKESKSYIYLNNTQREEKKINGKMVIHYDSPKYGKNQIAYLGEESLTLILPSKEKLILSIKQSENTTIIEIE